MWLTDFPDVAATSKNELSVDDRIAEKIVHDSIKKKNNRYLLKMPFKTDPLKIPNNRYVAVKRCFCSQLLSQTFWTATLLYLTNRQLLNIMNG